MKISVCGIMWNEEAMLPIWFEQLRNMKEVMQIILVDTGSVDNSVKVAKSLGIQVEEMDFRGFDAARNRAIELAEHEWLALQWDCDELFSKGFSSYIASLEGKGQSFRIPRFIDIWDRDYVLFCRNSSTSTRYLVHKDLKPRYDGYFPESIVCKIEKCVGDDPIHPGNIRTQPGLIHARYLKMWINSIKKNEPFLAHEGLSRLRYFMNRTWHWDVNKPVGPEYVKAALEEYKQGKFDKVNYIGNEEIKWMTSIGDFHKIPIEEYLDANVVKMLDWMPHKNEPMLGVSL